MAMIKPNKPECFDSKRDQLAVETFLYQVKQYLLLIQIDHPDVALTDSTEVSFASTFLKHTGASWGYVKAQCNQVPDTWAEFENALRTEFIPHDSIRRARDKLRKLTERPSVSAYLAGVRNKVLTVPGITEDEKRDRFCTGLKPQVKLEVLKSNPTSFDEAAQVALSVDSAMFGAGMFNSWRGQSRGSSTPNYQPMEIGNIEKRQQHYGGNGFRNNNMSVQRKRDLKKMHVLLATSQAVDHRSIRTSAKEVLRRKSLGIMLRLQQTLTRETSRSIRN